MAVLTIAKVEGGTSKNGKPYLKITDTGNNWYSMWDMRFKALAVAGATVEADVEDRNGYKNILTISRTLPAANGQTSVGGSSFEEKRARAIARQVAIKAAVDFMGGWDPADRTLAVLFDAANQMFNWIVEAEEDGPF